jgi:uncharacterized protein (TIGR02444 family)
MAEQISAAAFWQFSLQLYPTVKRICLAWQNELGANVNLVLLLCLLEQRQLGLTQAQLQQLMTAINEFSTRYTQPLRALRKQSHTAAVSAIQQQQLKQTLLQAELELEKLEQQLLVQYCPELSSAASPLLDDYLALLTPNCTAHQRPLFDLRQAIAQLA